ncbi:MAG: GTP 3',8-cyclase MoaA [Actinomycetota bacterium]|nr:GTP 3',8-cyclase MoaA [Actinomycetota bacterium]
MFGESDSARALVSEEILDELLRPMRDLRVSVTDRCNLRCTYCMPEAEYLWLDRSDLLSFEELMQLIEAFTSVGVDKVRLTGGEPLLRRGLPDLVAAIASHGSITDLALTTNGVLLAQHAEPLHRAGLGRVTVSLDTLRRERFKVLAQRDHLDQVLHGLRVAVEVGFEKTKVDTVVVRGSNDDELCDLLDLGRTLGIEVRFIEYMDVGGATRWRPDLVVTANEMIDRIRTRRGPVTPLPHDSAPARRYRMQDGTIFGIVASTSQPFCSSCNRSRLTADGMWFDCLYASAGVDLRTPLRDGAGGAELRRILTDAWQRRDAQGAVIRLESANRSAVPVSILRRDRHLEMHTRGG